MKGATMTIPRSTVEERIERGATLLDKERPGWREKIDTDDLDLARCDKCVLGQLFKIEGGGARDRFMATAPEIGIKMEELEDYGFDVLMGESSSFTDYQLLTNGWRRFLEDE